MILCMPTVGQKVRVLDGQSWKFKLYYERRNYGAIEFFIRGPLRPDHLRSSFYDDFVGGREAWEKTWGLPNRVEPERKHEAAVIGSGSILTIDRIYIRKGAGEYDSLTLILNDVKIPGKKGIHARVRFWVRLDDVNQGNLELLP
jgi:hypothetical protein